MPKSTTTCNNLLGLIYNATGLEDGAPVFNGLDGTTDRVTATYTDGTRVIVTRDAS